MNVIYQIAAVVRQQEYQHARALGYSFGAAVDMSWIAYREVVDMGRDAILSRSRRAAR